MLTILWDNDGVPVDTEGLYFRTTLTLRTVGICLTADQFKEISLRRGESTFVLAAEQELADDEIGRLRAERDRRYTELVGSQSWAIDGAEEVLRVAARSDPHGRGDERPEGPLRDRPAGSGRSQIAAG